MNPWYTTISVSLVLFSWLASLAFFLAGEASLITRQQITSPEYLAYQQQVTALKEDINSRQALVTQQLGSRYHQQWKAGDQQLQTIAAAQQALSELLARENNIGKNQAMAALPSQRLFVAIASVVNSRPDAIRIAGFAVLALLLEVCGLAMISLEDAMFVG